MLDRTRLPAGGNLDHVVAHEVAGAMRERKAAASIVAIPPAGLEREQIVAKIKVDGNSFAGGPVAIWIQEKILWIVGVGNGAFVHCHQGAFLYFAAGSLLCRITDGRRICSRRAVST